MQRESNKKEEECRSNEKEGVESEESEKKEKISSLTMLTTRAKCLNTTRKKIT